MSGEDDEREREFAEDTVIDGAQLEAVPEPVPSKDSTGKYKTLPGLAEAVEDTRDHYLALGEMRGLKKAFTTLKLIRIGAGDHPATADALVAKFKKWMVENEALIRAAMDED